MDPDLIVRAAHDRAAALAAADPARLTALLHGQFRWTSHRGETFGRDEYVDRNTRGRTVWRSQDLEDPHVTVVGTTAVLTAVARDVVVGADGADEEFRMPLTQTWVLVDSTWLCLAGHAGPRLA